MNSFGSKGQFLDPASVYGSLGLLFGTELEGAAQMGLERCPCGDWAPCDGFRASLLLGSQILSWIRLLVQALPFTAPLVSSAPVFYRCGSVRLQSF